MLRDMVVASSRDVDKPPKILLTLIFVIDINGSQGLNEYLEVKIGALVKKFDDWNFGLLPDILNEKGEVKSLQEWKDQVAQVKTSQAKKICDEMDFIMLRNSMDRLMNTGAFLEEFDEENEVEIRYIP